MGFEPTVRFRTSDFKSDAFDHSATSPDAGCPILAQLDETHSGSLGIGHERVLVNDVVLVVKPDNRGVLELAVF